MHNVHFQREPGIVGIVGVFRAIDGVRSGFSPVKMNLKNVVRIVIRDGTPRQHSNTTNRLGKFTI